MHPLTFIFLVFVLLTAIRGLLRHLPSLRRRRLSRLSQKHIWITGASRGLGLALSRLATAHGALVSLTSRNPVVLAEITRALAPSCAAAFPGDVSDATVMASARKGAEDSLGAVDILIANAGVNNGGLPLAALTDAVIDEVVDTNFKGVLRCFRACLPGMLERRRGVLCAVGSLAGCRGVPGASVYGGSKAAVRVLCESLRVELAGSGVRVLCVAPGFVETGAIEGMHHPKPFLMTADAAAEVVLDACVSPWIWGGGGGFPWVMEEVVMRASMWLPEIVYEGILGVGEKMNRGLVDRKVD